MPVGSNVLSRAPIVTGLTREYDLRKQIDKSNCSHCSKSFHCDRERLISSCRHWHFHEGPSKTSLAYLEVTSLKLQRRALNHKMLALAVRTITGSKRLRRKKIQRPWRGGERLGLRCTTKWAIQKQIPITMGTAASRFYN